MKKHLLILFTLSLLTACGGGASSSKPSNTDQSNPDNENTEASGQEPPDSPQPVIIDEGNLDVTGDDFNGDFLPTNPGQGLVANDLSPHPMRSIAKPAYLDSITDPSFGTTIRRISNAQTGKVIKPMYSTVQAWNADETYLILYDQGNGVHQLLNGKTYALIRNLTDVNPDDLEQIFWDHNAPDIFYYMDGQSEDFIQYSISTQDKTTLTNFKNISECSGNIELGNNVQMMSWDSDVVGFRCNNESAYSYRISSNQLTQLTTNDVTYNAPMPSASGNLLFHHTAVHEANGAFKLELNKNGAEHESLGKLGNGNDALFSISFEEGPQGGCIGNIVAHDLSNGKCFDVITQNQGYAYPKSGTHISALAHKNPGWITASMIGYDEDGQSLLDQELVLVNVKDKDDISVYRIGHHRADENEFVYWGEPHAVISPSGTRVLFGSDWSGSDDGQSVDSYVVELPAYQP